MIWIGGNCINVLSDHVLECYWSSCPDGTKLYYRERIDVRNG
jgi:hypothetical protein